MRLIITEARRPWDEANNHGGREGLGMRLITTEAGKALG